MNISRNLKINNDTKRLIDGILVKVLGKLFIIFIFYLIFIIVIVNSYLYSNFKLADQCCYFITYHLQVLDKIYINLYYINKGTIYLEEIVVG